MRQLVCSLSTNLSAILAARGNYRVDNLANFFRQARDLTLAWSGVFLVLLGAAALLKVAEEFSRGATLTFFALGLLGMIAWRGLLARFLVHALSEGAFASRKVIVIGERSHFAVSRTISEIQRFGYTPVQTFEIGEEDFARGVISARLRETIDEAIEVARSNSVAEVLLLIGWDRSSVIESVAADAERTPDPCLSAAGRECFPLSRSSRGKSGYTAGCRDTSRPINIWRAAH